MNILYHHRTQGRGAEGVHIREIIKALRKLGHEVFIVSPPGVDVLVETADKDRRGIAKILSVISRSIPQICFELMELIYNFTASRNIEFVMRSKKIDFIYERYAFFCWAGVKAATKHKIPIILEVNEVSGIKRVRGQILKGMAGKVEQENFEDAAGIVVVSNFLRTHIGHMVSSPEKVMVIPNAVDLANFALDLPASNLKKKFGLHNEMVLGFVGGFVHWHNFDLLLEALKGITGKRKDVKLIMVGEGPLEGDLRSKAESMGLADDIIFTGSFTHKDIPAVIQSMDICVIPHSNEYRSPIKLFEYMAMAKPVVAPRVEPIESILKDGEEVLLFTTGDRESLQEKIEILIDDRLSREKIGRAARKVIEENFLWENNALKVIKTIEGIGNNK